MKKLIVILLAFSALSVNACQLLSKAMNLHYGAGWEYKTDPNTGTDIAPALEAALLSGGEVCIDRGNWALKRPVSTAALAGGVVRGVSSQQSKVFYQSGSGAPFHFTGENGRTGGGLHGLAIVLDEGYGLSSAFAIKLQGDSTFQPDQMMFSDLYVTSIGDSYWYAGLFVDGRARTSPQGVRVSNASNIQIFKAHALGVWLSNVVQWTLTNVGVYSGIGTGNNMYLAGGGNQLTNSVQVYLTGVAVSGEINITNVSGFSVSGVCGRIATMSNATSGTVTTRCPVVGLFGSGVHQLP